MTGGQDSLLDNSASETINTAANKDLKRSLSNRPALKIIPCNETERQQHEQRLMAIEKASGGCVWNK